MYVKTTVKKGSGRFLEHGVWWSPYVDRASMQLDCIRAGGKWLNKSTGEMAGSGLFYHYKTFQEIVWPEKIWERGPYKNHWAEKILECWLEAQYLGILGCASSGKSDNIASILLVDWYAFPDCTTTLVTSTDMKSLERRIWGYVKDYHRRAKTQRDWIPGHLIEGKQMIIQDARNEFELGRAFKNGICGVPTLRGTSFVGLGPLVGLHNKRVRLIADEANLCFPTGTLVDTPSGPARIETLKAGDKVIGAAGVCRVKRSMRRFSKSLVRITANDGRKIVCTPNHPFFTQFGWIKAGHLNQSHYILSANEAMRVLQQGILPETVSKAMRSMCLHGQPSHLRILPQYISAASEMFAATILQSELLGEMEDGTTGNTSQDFHRRTELESCPVSKSLVQQRKRLGVENETIREDEKESSHEQSRLVVEDESNFEKNCSPSIDSRRQRDRTHKGRMAVVENVPGISLQLSGADGETVWQWISQQLQGGHSIPGFEIGSGSRWEKSFVAFPEKSGFEKGHAPAGAWVDDVTLFKSGNLGISYDSDEGYPVFNLEVERHPSYSINGFLVHNCPRAYLDATSNLSKCQDFRLVAIGNPNETTNAHGVVCEPSTELGGWEGGIDQSPGTKTWKTRFPNGIALQLPGSDSPNLKAGENEDVPFPFLITRKQMEDDAAIWSKSDWHYQMFVDAKMPRGQGTHRVITRQECEKNGATLEPFWRDSNITKIASLDAAYRGAGGDRCVFTEIHFGRESESTAALMNQDGIVAQKSNVPQGRQILALVDQVVIPIDAGLKAETPESQIVSFVKAQCENRGIPPANFFFDAGMRTSLVQQFSRDWSLDVQSIDCGASPTEQPVSLEIRMPCKDYYKKLVTELWFSVRLVVISKQFRNMSKDVMWELCAREWKTTAGNKIEVETKDEMRCKTGKSPDCFIAGTLVATESGQVPIENIREGDMVQTPFGLSPVIAIHCTESQSLTTVDFTNGTTLTGKPKHKVFTWNRGWVELSKLELTDSLESDKSLDVWHLANILFTKAGNSGFKAKVDTIRTATTGRIKARDFFIESSGLSTTALLLTACACIIKMGIGEITKSKTWNSFLSKSTLGFTWLKGSVVQGLWKSMHGILQRLNLLLQNGTGLKLEANGIASIPNSNGKTENPRHTNVLYAAKSSPHFASKAKSDFVHKAATININGDESSLVESVWNAVRCLWSTNILTRHIAVKSVAQSTDGEIEKVYNLTLAKHNAYYANGILVQNCADSLTLAIFGARQRGFQIAKLIPPKPERRQGRDWRDELREKSKKIWQTGQLEHASG